MAFGAWLCRNGFANSSQLATHLCCWSFFFMIITIRHFFPSVIVCITNENWFLVFDCFVGFTAKGLAIVKLMIWCNIYIYNIFELHCCTLCFTIFIHIFFSACRCMCFTFWCVCYELWVMRNAINAFPSYMQQHERNNFRAHERFWFNSPKSSMFNVRVRRMVALQESPFNVKTCRIIVSIGDVQSMSAFLDHRRGWHDV